jgi:F-type H+-transporting ATPase subunit gamma
MATLKEYNVKLVRLRSTRKLTRTMKLVSVTKLRRAQEAEKRVGRFVGKVRDFAARLAMSPGAAEHPLMMPHRNVGTVLLLLVTADRGLCGGFNSNLTKAALEWRQGQLARGRRVLVSCCGRRGHDFLKSRVEIERYYEGVVARPDFQQAHRIGKEIQAAFLGQRIDEVYLGWNASSGLMGYAPKFERLAPIDPALFAGSIPAATGSEDWLLEPACDELLGVALPRWLNLKVYSALLSSAVGEHGARMRAMDQASTNADNLILQITLQRNRVRQAAITTELTEIVAGAEALR